MTRILALALLVACAGDPDPDCDPCSSPSSGSCAKACDLEDEELIEEFCQCLDAGTKDLTPDPD